MYQIKNVVNYDREALEQELAEDAKRFFENPEVKRLMRRNNGIRIAHAIVSRTGLVCALGGLTFVILGKFVVLARILNLPGLALASLGLFVLGPAVPEVQSKSAAKLYELMEANKDTPAMRFHMFLGPQDATRVEIWGAETEDGRFEVTLSKDVDGKRLKETFVCDFEERSSDGVLTLDLRNGLVFRE